MTEQSENNDPAPTGGPVRSNPLAVHTCRPGTQPWPAIYFEGAEFLRALEERGAVPPEDPQAFARLVIDELLQDIYLEPWARGAVEDELPHAEGTEGARIARSLIERYRAWQATQETEPPRQQDQPEG